MKRFFIILLSILCTSQFISAQAYEGKIEYDKKDEDAIIIEFPYPPSVVEGAIVDKLEKMGFKAKETRGFYNYKGITIGEISVDNMDYIVKVERKSRKDKDESIVYLVMKTTTANPLTLSDSNIKEKAKAFLVNLTPTIQAYSLEQEILAQQEVVDKAAKKLSGLQDDLQDLEKKKRKLESDIEDNKKDQEKQKQEIDKQKQVLEALKDKRKA